MSHILTDQTLTIFTDRPYTFARATVNSATFDTAIAAINEGDYDRAVEILSPRKTLETFFTEDAGNVRITDGQVYYNDTPIDNYSTYKALQFAREGLPYKPILHFIERVQENPSYRAVQELYGFLEKSQMPLTADGHFLAYKKVRKNDDGNLVDIRTRTFNNNPGTVVQIPRNQVDENSERTCSNGLHVCSHEYLPHFGCGHSDCVVTVKVDPADVVAIPRDYNDAKMRVCRYEVLQILEDHSGNDNIWAGSSYIDDEVEEEIDDTDDTLEPATPEDEPAWIVNDFSQPYGEMPEGLNPDDLVEVMNRYGHRYERRANDVDWDNDACNGDVVQYRLIEKAADPDDLDWFDHSTSWASVAPPPNIAGDQTVTVRLRNGTITRETRADRLNWDVTGSEYDIAQYCFPWIINHNPTLPYGQVPEGLGKDDQVEVVFRNGTEDVSCVASAYRWNHTGSLYDIVKYRKA